MYGLVFVKGFVGCVKIMHTSPVLLEYYPCAIAKVFADGWLQFCIDSYPELGRQCGKGEYACESFFIK